MIRFLFLCLLLPSLAIAQRDSYHSAEVNYGFAKGLDNNSYGLTASGNLGLSQAFFLGVSTGGLKISPFLRNVVFPLSLRATFFPFTGEETTQVFVLAEGGKLFYREAGFGGRDQNVLTGALSWFGGAGAMFPTPGHLKPYVALGLAGLNFYNDQRLPEGAGAKQAYRLKRFTIRAGILLQRTSHY